MPGYWIVNGGDVKDEAALKAYNNLFAPIAKRYAFSEAIKAGELPIPVHLYISQEAVAAGILYQAPTHRSAHST